VLCPETEARAAGAGGGADGAAEGLGGACATLAAAGTGATGGAVGSSFSCPSAAGADCALLCLALRLSSVLRLAVVSESSESVWYLQRRR
jgi:hypothetical protein